MARKHVAKLADCTEYRQSLLGRPPAVIHAAVMLLMALVAAAVAWAALTEADLVVRAAGRIRPMTSSNKLTDAVAEECSVAAFYAGHVVRIHVREGQHIRKGDPLIQFDTRELCNAVAKHERRILAVQAEVARGGRLKRLLRQRYETAKAKADAESAQAQRDIQSDKQRRNGRIRLATIELKAAEDRYQRFDALRNSEAVAESEWVDAESKLQTARLGLQTAEIGIDEGRIRVHYESARLVDREYQVALSKLETEQASKRADLDTANLELDGLRLRREQMTLVAPCHGVVTSLTARVGDVVPAGQVSVKLADPQGYRLDVLVASHEVGHIRENMPVRVKLDAYDFQKYGTLSGRVVFISPDSQVAGGVRGASTPYYTIKVALDTSYIGNGDFQRRIKLGMTGQAEIVTGRESILGLLLRAIRGSISLG